MQAFLKKLSIQQQQQYAKLKIFSSLSVEQFNKNVRKKTYNSFNGEDIFIMCKYTKPLFLQPLHQKLSGWKDHDNNTCLHIAAQYGNIQLLKYLIKKKKISPNCLNNHHQTALIYALKTNLGFKFEKVILELMQNTNLHIKDNQNNAPHQIEQPIMNQSRVRIIEQLKRKYYQTK